MKKYIIILGVLALLLLMALPAIAEPVIEPPASPVMIDLTEIVTAALGLLAALITAYVLPWIKAKLGAQKYENAMMVTRTLVEAAEQIFKGPGRGAEKVAYVQRQLAARGITFDKDAVEAAVYKLGGTLITDEIKIEATQRE
jgi:hypothetical protein